MPNVERIKTTITLPAHTHRVFTTIAAAQGLRFGPAALKAIEKWIKENNPRRRAAPASEPLSAEENDEAIARDCIEEIVEAAANDAQTRTKRGQNQPRERKICGGDGGAA